MIATAHVLYNSETNEIYVCIPLRDGMGDHVVAVLPATPPPADE